MSSKVLWSEDYMINIFYGCESHNINETLSWEMTLQPDLKSDWIIACIHSDTELPLDTMVSR